MEFNSSRRFDSNTQDSSNKRDIPNKRNSSKKQVSPIKQDSSNKQDSSRKQTSSRQQTTRKQTTSTETNTFKKDIDPNIRCGKFNSILEKPVKSKIDSTMYKMIIDEFLSTKNKTRKEDNIFFQTISLTYK